MWVKNYEAWLQDDESGKKITPGERQMRRDVLNRLLAEQRGLEDLGDDCT